MTSQGWEAYPKTKGTWLEWHRQLTFVAPLSWPGASPRCLWPLVRQSCNVCCESFKKLSRKCFVRVLAWFVALFHSHSLFSLKSVWYSEVTVFMSQVGKIVVFMNAFLWRFKNFRNLQSRQHIKYHEEIANLVTGLLKLPTEHRAATCVLCKYRCYCYSETVSSIWAGSNGWYRNSLKKSIETVHKDHK